MEPTTELDQRFSSEGAAPTPWADARRLLDAAKSFWVTTVRADGRPHATTLLAVLHDDRLYFCTGPTEQKYKNLDANPHCILSTGLSDVDGGVDIAIEGQAERVADDAVLAELAAAWESKYGPFWHFDVRNGAFHAEGREAHVFQLVPSVGFGFAKGEFGQTRWRFG